MSTRTARGTHYDCVRCGRTRWSSNKLAAEHGTVCLICSLAERDASRRATS